MVVGKLYSVKGTIPGVVGQLFSVKAAVEDSPAIGMLFAVEARVSETTTWGRLYSVSASVPPSVEAGPNRYGFEPGVTIPLVGQDSGGTIRTWAQVSGPPVAITGSGAEREIVAPALAGGALLVFSYVVDGSLPDYTEVGIMASTESTTDIDGNPRGVRWELY